MIYTLLSLIPRPDCSTQLKSGQWVAAVPLPFYGGYLQGAWAVLCGKAVAVRYPTHGEFEEACHEAGWDVRRGSS